MKLFAVGNFDEYDVYALVMAETQEEALEKIKNLKNGDSIGGYGNDDYVLEASEVNGRNILSIIKSDRVIEIPSGIYIAINA